MCSSPGYLYPSVSGVRAEEAVSLFRQFYVKGNPKGQLSQLTRCKFHVQMVYHTAPECKRARDVPKRVDRTCGQG
jgi:hypothetical protein